MILALSLAQLATAQITVHDFRLDEKRRSVDVAQLIADATAKYPELAAANLKTEDDEVAALLVLGQKLAEYRLKLDSSTTSLKARVKELEQKPPGSGNSDFNAYMKEKMAEMTSLIGDMRLLPPLAKRAYDLAKTYKPAPSQRTRWLQTWSTVKRLIPQHM